MEIITKLFELSPYLELLERKIYFKFIKDKYKTKKYRARHYLHAKITKVDVDSFILYLKSLGVKKGDLLIVHSSIEGLQALNCRENQLLDQLIDLVGEQGTIALPAFPDESKLKDKNGTKIYDPRRSVAWTGMLPNLMLRKKGAIRSAFPCNPLVAYGRLAEDMMSQNLETKYAHGKNSCWGYCVEHHAKILYLGLPAYHSCTVIHVSEDYQPDFWPANWYMDKKYYVKEQNELKLIHVKVRDSKWSQYISERYTERKYIRRGFIKEADYCGITIRYIEDSNTFINAILSDWNHLKFFYLSNRMVNKENGVKKI